MKPPRSIVWGIEKSRDMRIEFRNALSGWFTSISVLSQIKSAAELLWFRKPPRAPNSESNLMIIQSAPSIAKHIILVVDDDEAVRNSVRNMMESEGFEVRAFSNGHDLLNEANLARGWVHGRRLQYALIEWIGTGWCAARSRSVDAGHSNHRKSNQTCSRPCRSNCGFGRRKTAARKLSGGLRP